MEAAPSSATGLQLRKNVRTAASGPLSPEHVDPGDECQLPNVRTTSISSQSKLSRNVRSQVNRSRSPSPPAQDGCALTLERELDEVVRSRSRSHRATRVPSRSDLNVQGHDLRFCAGLTLLLPTNHTSSRIPKADRVLGHQPRRGCTGWDLARPAACSTPYPAPGSAGNAPLRSFRVMFA